jgi:urease accessory protein
MTALAPTAHQRSEGEILLRVGTRGLVRMREAGAAKVRLPQGGHEAILINTGGGLAGGDHFTFDIGTEKDTTLVVTAQAAERVYRSLGPAANIDVKLTAARGSTLHWLPQESILFDGAALRRTITADLGPGARFLAVESIVLGRTAMGETVHHAALQDRWRIRREGRLIFADDLGFEGRPPVTTATLDSAKAFATVVLVDDSLEDQLELVRQTIGAAGSASAWSGKLVARLAARDSFELRKALIPALAVLAGGLALPKVWSL